ncbi:PEP-CTERM sorting domain-containing protein [Poriferisphaera sp. WC338]|uniref:PEP-CTERM sorting domain-containing protein n=1 Tax=Poriferisphaera sp. WC338 TaxID=3425129 RepID=UPI003D817361
MTDESLTSIPLFNLNDFIGTGEVTVLGAYIGIPADVDFTSSNVDEAEASVEASLYQYGPISLTYTYTPIPEPASMLLLSLGLIPFATRKHTRG